MTAENSPFRWPAGLLAPALSPVPPARRAAWLAVCAALTVAISIVEYVVGADLSLSILYLVPIFATTWVAGRTAGLAMSLFATFAWFAYDHMIGQFYPHPLLQLWEGAIRLITWGLFVLLLAGLKEALRRADERFITVLNGLDAAVYVTDPRNGELLFTNEHCCTVFGDALQNAAQIESRLRPGVAVPGTRAAEFEDAQQGRWYFIRKRVLRWVDGRDASLHVATDVTERKRAEADLRLHQEKLDFTSRLITIGEMASTIAHEISQPLAAIANYTMGCARRLRAAQWREPDVLDAMEKAAAQAERARAVVQRVRELVRRRDRDIELADCDIGEVVAALAPLIEADAARHATRIVFNVGVALPPVRADRIMIEQVVLNLTRNAIESMADTAPAQRRITIAVAGLSGGVELTVSDRGPGVPAELSTTLFAPFFTTKPGGTGLGLHVCRSIAELHQARLWVTPNPGGGSIFHFSVPGASA